MKKSATTSKPAPAPAATRKKKAAAVGPREAMLRQLREAAAKEAVRGA